MITQLKDLVRYIAFAIVEGDWQNDFLSHLPDAWTPTLTEIGRAIALVFN